MRITDLAFTGALAALALLASAGAGEAGPGADAPQVFTLKGARLVETHDVFRNGELVGSDFTVGAYAGHAVFDPKGGASWTAGPCRFVLTPGEDRNGDDLGWVLAAHDLAGGPCPGVASGHYLPPK
ncbi:hypothetical protein ACO2Q3_22555 [Caulobacter sp. KR2-114]|uniref:hypothetical protein n=1 Tax=Caulobacter sp. KR2-114 TaxID=3400912 RepID=UPI003C120F29